MIAATFYDHLIEEVLHNESNLPDAACRTLRCYYYALANHPQQRAFYRYNWLRRTDPLTRLLIALPPRNTPWRLLDAGCGVGTEALFWSYLRSAVEGGGIDLDAPGLAVARTRQAAREQQLGRTLSVHFEQRNIFDVLQEQRYDLVWSIEVISHIDSTEDFVQAVADNLPVDGHLIISDSHVMNPAIAWRIWQMRRRGVAAHTHKTTATGETVSYAQELVFTVWQLRRMLRQAGFYRQHTQMSIFFPPAAARMAWLFPLIYRVDRALNRVPLLRYVGGIYTVIGAR